jgi:hypothetical protein
MTLYNGLLHELQEEVLDGLHAVTGNRLSLMMVQSVANQMRESSHFGTT